MEMIGENASGFSLSMATEEHYRMRAASYRSSKEYNRMIGLYSVLKESIEDCQNETLVNWAKVLEFGLLLIQDSLLLKEKYF